jgi:hypothetical protein
MNTCVSSSSVCDGSGRRREEDEVGGKGGRRDRGEIRKTEISKAATKEQGRRTHCILLFEMVMGGGGRRRKSEEKEEKEMKAKCGKRKSAKRRQ